MLCRKNPIDPMTITISRYDRPYLKLLELVSDFLLNFLSVYNLFIAMPAMYII